jgi:3-deoxy-D-manno-octulosonate 8-phosphate phosphatase (KDO 8-P phosphatase)
MNTIPQNLIERIKPIELLLLDVDGTLSDGRLHYDAEWIEGKSFDVRDGFGIYLAHHYGIKTGLVTGRQSRIVTERARELNIELVYQGRFDKGLILDEIINQTGLKPDQIGFVGDDLFDLPLLKRVGFAAAPADAHEEVRSRVHFVSQYAGGRGAVREVIELILKGKGLWEEILQRFYPAS